MTNNKCIKKPILISPKLKFLILKKYTPIFLIFLLGYQINNFANLYVTKQLNLTLESQSKFQLKITQVTYKFDFTLR